MPTELESAIAKLNKSYGEELFTFGNNIPKILDKIPFSSPRANYMTYGGIPVGRLVEFAGEEGSGKTTTALDIVANAQIYFQQQYDKLVDEVENSKSNKSKLLKQQELINKGPKKVLYVDAENTIDEDWAILLGVQLESVIFYKPQNQCAEEIFEDIMNLISTGELGLVVLDSLGCLVSQQAYSKTIEEKTYGGIAMALTLFARKAAPVCAKYNCTFIGINQVRDNLNSPYGGVITTGGRGWKHECSLRIMFKKGKFIDENCDEIKNSSESPFGNRVLMSIEKTKCFKPDRRAGFYTLSYYDGIMAIDDLFEIAMMNGIINKAGAWFTFVNVDTGELFTDEDGEILKAHGRPSALRILDENEVIRTYVDDKVKDMINGNLDSD